MCYSRPTVYVYVPNFVSISLFCRPLVAKNSNFGHFWTSASSGVAIWQHSEKVEHGCTTTNLPLSNGIKIVSVLQRLHGEIGRTNSDVQKRDGQTDKKTQRFWPPQRRVKSEPHQTWHGDRGPRTRSCTLKTLVSLLGGAENLGITRPCQLKTAITLQPLKHIQRNFNR